MDARCLQREAEEEVEILLRGIFGAARQRAKGKGLRFWKWSNPGFRSDEPSDP